MTKEIKAGSYAKAKLGSKEPYRQVYIKKLGTKNAEISWSTGRTVVSGHINKKYLKPIK